MHTLTLEEAIQRLPLNLLARRLAIPGEIPDRDGKTVRCFFPDRHANGDRNPSFNFHDGLTRFKCHGCGIQGRGPDLVVLVLGLDPKEAVRRFIEMAGGIVPHTARSRKSRQLHRRDDHHLPLELEREPYLRQIREIGWLLGQNSEVDVNLRKLERLRTKLSEIDRRFVRGLL